MKAHTAAILLVCLTLPACKEGAASQPTAGAAADEKEYQSLEGTWKYTSFQLDGVKMPAELFENHQYVFKGDQYTHTDAGGVSKGTFKLDPSKRPRTIELTDAEGPAKGIPLPGIYELEGDTLKLCLALGSEDVPTQFVSKSKSGHGLKVLSRVTR